MSVDDPSAEAGYDVETVELASLRPHPRNYRDHPEDQLAHIVASIRAHGVYRPIVVARDGTILAGHGVALALGELGIERAPVVRLDVEADDPRAIQVLTGDNEIGKLAEGNDRALTVLLRELRERDPLALLGTGFDDAMLSALVMVTRPASEIADIDEAARWVGLPEYQTGEKLLRVVVLCESSADRQAFLDHLGATVIDHKGSDVWSIYWPLRTVGDDRRSLKFGPEAAP